MFTFKKAPTFLGIDFGMSRIKAVELTMKNSHPHLVNYGDVAVDFSDVKSTHSSPEEKIQLLLSALTQKMQPLSTKSYVAMPGFSGLITLIELPKMAPNELEKAIRFEAQKYMPAALDEVVLSWEVLSKNENASGKIEVLLVAALHKEVEKYEKLISSTGLSIEVLELETFSLVRSLIPDHDRAFLIIDIGSRSTNLVLVDKGLIRVNRNVNTGGYDITTTLSEALNIAWDRADTFKMSGKNFLDVRESGFVFPSIELIVNESRRMLSAYQSKQNGKAIDQILLSGGSSQMTGLDAYMTKLFGIPSTKANPWMKVQCDEKVRPLIDRLGASYSVAVGLALAGVEAFEND